MRCLAVGWALFVSAAAAASTTATVDCALAETGARPLSSSRVFATLAGALNATSLASTPTTIYIKPGGICHLDAPIQLTAERHPNGVSLQGGPGPGSVISGGAPVTGWKPVAWPGAPTGAVFAADVGAWPVEIKTLRHGATRLSRSRFPPLAGDGRSSRNWLFAADWSVKLAPSDSRQLQQLGMDPSRLPAAGKANLSSLVGAYAHVLGCIENDVNSQLTKVLSVGGSASKPTLGIEFRNSFNVNQRYYLENVRWALSPGTFYHDEPEGMLYYWPLEKTTSEQLVGVVAPKLDRLIELDHTAGHAIRNLTFTDATYYADGYWDGPAQEPSDAAIRINYSHDITISGCNFVAGLGGYGVAVGNGSTDVTISACLFDSLGQGGVIAYGFDSSPVPAGGGTVAGNNTQPQRVKVSDCVMQTLGATGTTPGLVHVAGVALRAASYCTVSHNRIRTTPRYGLEADSFYPGTLPNKSLVSRGNIFEYNIITDTNRLTTDTGAIEMLGSGKPESIAWWNNNTIRFNRISHTQGSSSSNGADVCVHGLPDSGCRDLVWGIYLDGGEAGIVIHGNIIDSTLHGAVFDNAGGNNSQTNNIFLGDASVPAVGGIMMDFGAPGQGAGRAIAGNVVKRNIFYWTGTNPHQIYASQIGWSPDFLKPNGSDYNLFWTPSESTPGTLQIFPGQQTLPEWQGASKHNHTIATCGTVPGLDGVMVVTATCDWKWLYNTTSKRLTSARDSVLAVAIDCNGNWDNCREGSTDTRLCLQAAGPWSPTPPPQPAVDNFGWIYDAASGRLSAVASGHCIEVCDRGGAVGGCNGEAGSRIQLAVCVPGAANQQWILEQDGTLRPRSLQAESQSLCLAPPSLANTGQFDANSIIADPLFVSPATGDFSLDDESPAITKLGFVPIPPITAPEARCGGSDLPSCLSIVLDTSQTEAMLTNRV